MKILNFLAVSLLWAGINLCSASEGMLNYTSGAGGYVTGTAGWSFQPTTNISVTSLGVFNYILTDQSPISVGLWDYNGTLLASNSISSTSLSLNLTRYEAITPVALTPGLTYYLGAYSPSGTIILAAESPEGVGGFATTSPEIQLGTAVYAANAFAFPNLSDGGPGAAFLVPNFQFDAVPEPSFSAFALLGGAVLAWRRAKRM